MYKKLLSASVVYTVLAFLQPLMSLLLQPLYLNWFSNDDYALFSLMNGYSSFITLISALGIGGGVFTFYYDYSHNKEELNRYIGQVLSFCFWSGGIFALLIFPFGNYLFSFLFSNEQSILFYPYGAIATFGGMAAAFVTPFVIFLRNENKLLLYTLLILLTALGSTVGQLVFVILFHGGLMGALWGKALGSVLGFGLVIWLNRKQLNWHLDWKYLRNTLHFMRFSTPASMIGWMYVYLDRFLVERFLSLLLVSMYSLLHVFTSTIEMASLAVRNAIIPFVFARLKQSEADGIPADNLVVYRFYYLFTILFASVVVAVVCNIHWLTSNTNYYGISYYVFLYASGYIIGSLIDIGNLNIYYEKKSLKLLLYGILSVGLSVAFNYFLIPIFQLWGVVMSSFLARFITFFAYFIPHRYILPTLFTIREYIMFAVVFAIFGIAHVLVTFEYLTINHVGLLQFPFIVTTLLLLNRSIAVQAYRKTLNYINSR